MSQFRLTRSNFNFHLYVASLHCTETVRNRNFFATGKMKKGDRVLIHLGSGGVGQAAINLALHEGCEVFTTVGSPRKKKFLLSHFSGQIKEDHIGNSRDCSFEKMIIEKTHGEGVDIVLSSLPGKQLLASVNCLARGGRFLEIGRTSLIANEPLGMEAFLREMSFHCVMLDLVGHPKNLSNKLQVYNLMKDGLKHGVIKPLVRYLCIIFQVF